MSLQEWRTRVTGGIALFRSWVSGGEALLDATDNDQQGNYNQDDQEEGEHADNLSNPFLLLVTFEDSAVVAEPFDPASCQFLSP